MIEVREGQSQYAYMHQNVLTKDEKVEHCFNPKKSEV